jgi:UDP-4-amino-4,6-dideoxy-N-acetyl-beta-L-altrosamine N-acetyltransferase
MTAEDLGEVLSWRNLPQVRNYMKTNHIITEEEHYSWWERVRGHPDMRYLIAEDWGKMKGVVSFSSINHYHGTGSWAFYIGVSERRRGMGSLLEFIALDYAFRDIGLRKLCCEVLSNNPAVVKLHQRFGFQIEGSLRAQFVRDDQLLDLVQLAMFRVEWEERHRQAALQALQPLLK